MMQALLLEVVTYGFLHAGVGPLRRESLKRSLPFLPGSMLYGVLQAALVRLDGAPAVGQPGVGARVLVDALQENRLRFMPLLPDRGQSITEPAHYCRQAQRLADEEGGRAAKGRKRQAQAALHYQTTPHAPLSRTQEQIEGSLLYAVEGHQPEQRYRGWIVCDSAVAAPIRRALGLFPFLPVGGKGKFTAAEARIVDTVSADTLVDRVTGTMESAGDQIEVELLTPAVLQGSAPGVLAEAVQLRPRPLRYYRVWRTGLYPDAAAGKPTAYGVRLDEGDLPLAWQPGGDYYAGRASHAVPGLPEGSRFTFDGGQARRLAEAFVYGVGRGDWSCLGWGQLFMRTSGAEE